SRSSPSRCCRRPASAPSRRIPAHSLRPSSEPLTAGETMTPMTHAPETKAAGADLAIAFDDLRYTLESYRVANDQRLAEIETRRGADPLTEEKMARMDAALDEAQRRIDRLTLDRNRPALAQDEAREPHVAEHKAAFASYIRNGEA